MSTRTITLSFTGAGTITAPGGRFFFIKSASSALAIRARGATAQPIAFDDVGAGLKFGPVPEELRWTYLDVTSTVAQVVTLIISDDAEVDVASTVNVAGQVSVMQQPSTTLSTPARIATNITTDTLLSAANANRRSITIQNPAANVDTVNVGASGELATDRGFEVEPGTSVTFVTSAAIYARAVTNTPSVQVIEET